MPRFRWISLGVVLALVAAVLVVGAIVVWGGSEGRPVDLDEARERLDPDTPTTDPDPALRRPAAGVYLATGEGTTGLDRPPRTQQQGPEMPVTVTHGDDGCWTYRIDYSTHHWQRWDFCPTADGLVETGGQTYQRWDFGVYDFETLSTFECPEALTVALDPDPGDEWPHRCEGTSDADDGTDDGATLSAGPYTYVGPEVLTIDGADVDTHRYEKVREMTGAQRGTEHSDVWHDAETGLVVRNERRLELVSGSIIGDVTYTETGWFQLEARLPAD